MTILSNLVESALAPSEERLGRSELVMPRALTGGTLFRRRSSDGRPIGYLRYRRYVDAWTLNEVFVEPRFREVRVATSLLNELLVMATRVDLPVVTWVVATEGAGGLDNVALEAWLRRHHFVSHPWARTGAVVLEG